MSSSSNGGLSDPGSSSYQSNSLTVGDGTWDTDRNTFLLPNLMGVNFNTMRYNGMGNRLSTTRSSAAMESSQPSHFSASCLLLS
jgi:hypothetical protein